MEHTIQKLEDMLRNCIIYFKGNRDNHFPLVEFSTTIVVIHLYIWLYMKPFMVGDVGPQLDGLKWESLFLGLKLIYKTWRRFILYEIT